jgi:hypothetical protein
MSDSDLDAPLWGAAAIANELRLSEKSFYYRASLGLLPVKKVGASFVSTRRRIRDFLNSEQQERPSASPKVAAS